VVSGGGVNPNQAGTTSSVTTGPIAGAAAPSGGLPVTGARLAALISVGALVLLCGLAFVAWYVRSRQEV
jgi:hypothetical protein